VGFVFTNICAKLGDDAYAESKFVKFVVGKVGEHLIMIDVVIKEDIQYLPALIGMDADENQVIGENFRVRVMD
jgi:hypothetical protein